MISLLEKEFQNSKNGGRIDNKKVSSSALLGSPQEGAIIVLDLEVKGFCQ